MNETEDGLRAKRFSGLLSLELNAVAARRRRYRIEALLGFLPQVPDVLPTERPAPAPPAPPAVVTFDELQAWGAETEGARKALEEARARAFAPRAVPAGPGAVAAPAGGLPLIAAAREFLRRARDWLKKAEAYRDQCFEAARAADATEDAEDEWERAEAILSIAANALSAAAKEVRAQEQERGGAVAAAQAVLSEAELHGLSQWYGHVLACEIAVHTAVAEFHQKTAAADRAAAWEDLCRERLCLARAEQGLFQAAQETFGTRDRGASCASAADAARQEVQRASHEGNRAVMDRAKGRDPTRPPAGPGGVDPLDPNLVPVQGRARDERFVGLCLCGGGIRSATFGLGVLQGLAQLRLLGMIDYLSTVSGGGYIGSWFAAWVKREGSLLNVQRQLSPNRVSQASARRANLPPAPDLEPEPEPVHHLRAYSRYLAPRFGPYSADTWTLFTTYFRNLFVSALFTLPLAMALVFLWRLPLYLYSMPLRRAVTAGASLEDFPRWVSPLGVVLSLGLLFAVAVGLVCMCREQEVFFAAELRRPSGGPVSHPLAAPVLLSMLLLTALGATFAFSIDAQYARLVPSYHEASVLRYFGQPRVDNLFDWLGASTGLKFTLCFAAPTLLLSAAGRTYYWGRRRIATRRPSAWNWRGLLGNAVLAACVGLSLWLVLRLVVWPLSYSAARYERPQDLCLLYAVGVPLLFGAMVLGGFAEMAVVGRWENEYAREWRSRLGACLLMWATLWLIAAGAILYLPRLFEDLTVELTSMGWRVTPGAAKGILTGLWAAVSGAGAWTANRVAVTGPAAARPWWVRPLLGLAPVVFLVGLLAGVSALGQWLLEFFFPAHYDGTPGDFLVRVTRYPWWATALGAVVAAIVACCASVRTRVNRFSLHMLYANRLVRCYLGASRPKRPGSLGAPTGVRGEPRQGHPFTGFDADDDLPLAELREVAPVSAGGLPYTGPLPILNCALNCLAGNELAYQDRRADAFALTPEECGGRLTGRAPTPAAGADANNLTLGRAMTISGAAVDPNMSGLSMPLTVLMTLLNTRLGWWLENPHPDRRSPGAPWRASEPGSARPLLYELFGLTNEDRDYVHLSDGGHFENLGVYDLIRRRCRFLVVVDCGTDARAASDNMAIMLRLVRTDFGVPIELDSARMQMKGADGRSDWHCALGRVRYDEVDEGAVPGTLVYLQASLTGDEPPDVQEYAGRHSTFPRQSTVNQFFDEAQFESYRMLGQHIATEVFGDAARKWSGQLLSPAGHRAEVQQVFAAVRERWLPPPGSAAERLAAAQAALQLEGRLAGEEDLLGFNGELYPELLQAGPINSREVLEFRAISQTLQVMEMAWETLNLAQFHAHPMNRGWMNTFRRWTGSRSFARFWPFLRAEYSKPFVTFCENVLNLQSTRVQVLRHDDAVNAGLTARWDGELDEQFNQEWSDRFQALGLPAAFTGASFVSDLVARARAGYTGRPFVWYVQQDGPAPAGAAPPCCGIVCAAAALRGSRARLLRPGHPRPLEVAEFFVWLRGPYRALGIGSQALRQILPVIESESAPLHPRLYPVRELMVYYPLATGGAGRPLELERWMTFFFDQDFRRVCQPDTGAASRFVVLTRKV